MGISGEKAQINRDKAAEAHELVKGGMRVKDAIAQVGVSVGTYAYYKKQEEKQNEAPKSYQAIPIEADKPNSFQISGSPEEIARFMSTLNKLNGANHVQ